MSETPSTWFDPYNPPPSEVTGSIEKPKGAKNVKIQYPQTSLFKPAPIISNPIAQQLMPSAPIAQGAREQYALSFGTTSGSRTKVRNISNRPKANKESSGGRNRLARAKASRKRGRSKRTANLSSQEEKKETSATNKVSKSGRPNPVWLKKWQFKKKK